jgi:hypothetical protein
MYDLGEPDAKTELQGLEAIDSFNKIDLEHSIQFEVHLSHFSLSCNSFDILTLPFLEWPAQKTIACHYQHESTY